MQLEAKIRTVFGKKVSSLRREGFVPGEIYGRGMENMHVSVSEKELLKVWKRAGENTVVTLKLDSKAGEEEMPTLISDISLDPLSHRPRAVDFRRVQKGEKIRVHVPIVLSGTSPATKEGLNILQTLSEIEIETLPSEIPHEFSVDISGLSNIGDGVSVKDISLPKGVKALTDEDTVIVTVSEPQKEEPLKAPESPVEGEGEPVETPTETEEKAS